MDAFASQKRWKVLIARVRNGCFAAKIKKTLIRNSLLFSIYLITTPFSASAITYSISCTPDYSYFPPNDLGGPIQGQCTSAASCAAIPIWEAHSATGVYPYVSSGDPLGTFTVSFDNHENGVIVPYVLFHCNTSDPTAQPPKALGGNTDTSTSTDGSSGGCGCGNQAQESAAKNNGTIATGEPIDIGSGNMFYSYTDYATSSANSLAFTRYYNSRATATTFATVLGKNWRSTYDRYLNVTSATSVTAERADGKGISFTYNGTAWVSDSDVDVKLAQAGTGTGSVWTLTDHGDTVEIYTQLASGEGQLQTIRARNGYTQTLTYNTSNQLTSVQDSFGRTLSFAYLTDTANAGLLGTVTTPDGLVLTYSYNSSGTNSGINDRLASVSYSTTPVTNRSYSYSSNSSTLFALTSVTDENGHVYASWTYDSAGRGLTSMIGSNTNTVTLTYNDTNGSRTVTNSLGETDTYKFTTLQGVPKVTEIDRAATSTVPAATETFTYDSNGYMASKTDWKGNVTQYVNNAHGDPTSITEAYGTAQVRTTTIAYDATWVHLPATITAPRLTTAFSYDSSGNMLTRTLTDTTGGSTNGQTRTWTYTYDSYGHVLTVTGPRTDVTQTTTYSYLGNNIATVTDALGHVSTVTSYNNSGQPLSMTDASGVITDFTYDIRNRLLTSGVHTTNGIATTTLTYDAAGNVTKINLPDNSYLSYTYDIAHRVTQVTDALGNYISYTLDPNGGITATQTYDPSATLTKTQTAVFDTLGRQLQQIGAASQTTAYGYDANGNVLSVSDPLTHNTVRSFDALNRLLTSIDPLNGTTTYAYDAQDHVTSIKTPRNLTTSYTYDGFGDVLSETSPEKGTTTYSYDNAGNRISETDARGVVTNRTFDKLDRVKTETYPASPSENVTYTYDTLGSFNYGVGRLTALADDSGTTTFGYNERGRPFTDTRVINGISYRVSYAYNLGNRIISITYPSGHIVKFFRDAAGRVKLIGYLPATGGTETYLVSAHYEPFGPLTAISYHNGVTTTNAYDQDYRLTGSVTNNSTQNLSFGYDAASNISSITDNKDNTRSQSFTYDADDHLLTASGKYGSLGYTYDADGNRKTAVNNGVTSTFNIAAGSNRIDPSVDTGSTSRTIGYTANGNITADSANATLAYNARNRVSTATSGTTTASFKYNALGQRVLKTVGSVKTAFIYDQEGRLLGEYDGTTGAMIREYVYLNDTPVAQIEPSDTFYYIHTDHLNTPTRITDASKAVVWDRVRMPFGEDYSLTGSLTHNLRFPGQYADVEFPSLVNNGFRTYDPTLGRYGQVDPIGLNGGVNVYGYVEGNPVKGVDPWGLDTVIVINYNGIGGHSGFFVTNGGDGHSLIYDPYGSYNPSNNAPITANPVTRDIQYPPRGSNGIIYGGNLKDYIKYQKTDGPNVQTYTFHTTSQEEAKIAEQAEELGESGLFGFESTCADKTSSALNGVGPFKNLGTYSLPSSLGNALAKLPRQSH